MFLHWKDNASENIYTAEALTKLQVKEDMNFTAVFGEDSYTITFITSNGSFEDGATQTTITKQGGQVLAENDFPTVTGNTANFTGWYCNGTTKSAEQWAGTPVNGSMTFVAAFEGKVTVSFNTMGGKWTDDGQQYANGIEGNAGEPMTLPTAEHITRTGYTFTLVHQHGLHHQSPGCVPRFSHHLLCRLEHRGPVRHRYRDPDL